jgi:hypothetical protein
MRRYYIVFGTLLIVSIIDFTVALPALVREGRHAGADVPHIPGDAITMLGKRAGEFNEQWLKYLSDFQKNFAKQEESPTTGPSSAMSSADHELMGSYALSNPGPSTAFDHEMIDAPSSPTVSDHEMMDVSPPPSPASPTVSDHEMVDVSPPPSSASRIQSDRMSPLPGSISRIQSDRITMGVPSLLGSASQIKSDRIKVGVPSPLGPASRIKSDRTKVDVSPPPGFTLPIQSDHELVVLPSSLVSSTDPGPQSMSPGPSSGEKKSRRKKKKKVTFLDGNDSELP